MPRDTWDRWGVASLYLMPVCRGNVIVLGSKVGCSYYEVHMKVAVIVLWNPWGKTKGRGVEDKKPHLLADGD